MFKECEACSVSMIYSPTKFKKVNIVGEMYTLPSYCPRSVYKRHVWDLACRRMISA